MIEVDDGKIASIGTAPVAGAVPLAGIALPGLVNAHSHAFHRLLRGRTHGRGGDFWAWRELMYRQAGSLDPDEYQQVATAVYVEMALAGVTAVGEFNYLHHQPGGARYSEPNEMAHALIRAARVAGIRISLLDVGYLHAGFDDEPLDPVQQRFSDGTVSRWLERALSLADDYRDEPDVSIGIAPHSVRALSPAELTELAPLIPAGTPVHVHVSEQTAENQACLAATGRTPVGLLGEAGLLGPETTLVHATHVSSGDIATIASSASRVCYCGTTERDLADGPGPASDLADAGVELCVGSDSHAIIDLFEEARAMEMHERLTRGKRGVLSPAQLAGSITQVGSQSLGLPATALSEGAPADFVVIDAESPRLAGADLGGPVDQVVFAASSADVVDVFVAGKRIVARSSHPAWEGARRWLRPGP